MLKAVQLVGSLAFVAGLFVSVFGGIPYLTIVSDDPVIPIWLRCAVFAVLGGLLIVLLSVAAQQRFQKPTELPNEISTESSVLILNSSEIPGRELSEILGLVQGHTVFAIWLGNDLSALMRLIIGGELTEYTEMMGSARKLAVARMLGEAENIGADAVINVRYMTTSVVGTASELLVYGTAVKLAQ